MRGLTDKSEIKEQIVKIDENTSKRYKVVEEIIDLRVLKAQKENLERELSEPEPTEEDLISLGKAMHPYYQNKEIKLNRIKELEVILNG